LSDQENVRESDDALRKDAVSQSLWRRFYAWCDHRLEYVLMNVSYGLCTLIVFEEAARRYLFHSQAPWGGQAAMYLFIWLSWIGCAYAIRKRAHLRFDQIRHRLPYTMQFMMQLVDYAAWILIAAIIMFFSTKQILVQAQLGSVVQGTDHFPLWVAFLGIPFGWTLVVWRALQCAIQDIRRYQLRQTFSDTFSLEEAA
jgi:TRAP-type C4-dicarboxylate transport system permease small subunit